MLALEIEPVSLGSVLWALAVYVGFVAALFAYALVMPGRKVQGQPLRDGSRLTYKLNGLGMYLATHMFVFVGARFFGLSLSPLLKHFWSLFIAVHVVTFVWLFLMFRDGKRRQPPEEKRGAVRELWEGVELNPMLLGVDLKTFAYQPSLIGLAILNAAFAFAQYEELGYLTTQMWLYQGFWWAYLTTHYYFEENVLSMWDVIAEYFGFMLLWGDLVLVPFFYCLPAWWVLAAHDSIHWTTALLLTVLNLLGLWIFRGSNTQKHRFKKDRNTTIWGRPARTIGGRLLVSGWWGIGRKINYTGEIMVYTSFALCAGLGSFWPFLLPLWLFSLLVHRAWRDEQRCSEKYGELWTEYTKIARFRMIPFIY